MRRVPLAAVVALLLAGVAFVLGLLAVGVGLVVAVGLMWWADRMVSATIAGR
jgi:hypothetical protein